VTVRWTDAAIEELARRFAAAAIPRPEWTHEAHLIMGAWHVHSFGPRKALEFLRERIRRLNEANGVTNSETEGYHETITRTYVALIADHLARAPQRPLAARVATLLAGPLAARDALLRHYSRARLFTPAARLGWVEPDLVPLPALAD
jgi:hypothetical protein